MTGIESLIGTQVSIYPRQNKRQAEWMHGLTLLAAGDAGLLILGPQRTVFIQWDDVKIVAADGGSGARETEDLDPLRRFWGSDDGT